MTGCADRRLGRHKEKPPEKRMTPEEIRARLEEIARNPKSYPTAGISAIRALLELEKKRPAPEPDDLFAELDEALPLRKKN